MAEGNLVIKDSWPGQMRTIWGDPVALLKLISRPIRERTLRVTAHVVMKMAITGLLVVSMTYSMSQAIVWVRQKLKVHWWPMKLLPKRLWWVCRMISKVRICAFVTLQAGTESTEQLRGELVAWVRKILGPVATPDALHWAPALPKTRSGKNYAPDFKKDCCQ